ncbi:MAG: hypothetical protein DWH94_03510 [Planctomycetota bacterium]|nr:MAG: hypothetical protein DWH94_03510 [Planctomycetota bacterium]
MSLFPTVVLLVFLNIFMTFAWYGHPPLKTTPLGGRNPRELANRAA